MVEVLFKTISPIVGPMTRIEHHGSGSLSGKMLLVRIVENNKIDAYFRAG